MKPKVINSETIYEGRVFDVVKEDIEENGHQYNREIIRHHGSAVIVPVFADQTVALVRQYRHAAGEYLLELPAGTLNENESPETGAKRELEEEIGVTAGKFEKLTEFFVSPGFLTEKMFVFLATDLTETAQNFDDDEFIEVEKLAFPDIYRRIKNGEFQDAKTIAGLILAGTKLGFAFE